MLHDGEAVRCRIRGRLRLKGIRSTNPVVVGDQVTCESDDGGDYVICDRENHAFYLIDGFLMTDNLKLNHVETVDLNFEYSDHNPVMVQVTLQ